MFTKKELTKERVDVMVAALEREKAGYEARLKALADGKVEHRTQEQLEARVAGVDAEIARLKKSGKKDS